MTPALAPAAAARAVNVQRALLLGVLTLAGVGLLAGLGLWQLERRAWKLALIDTVDARARAAVHGLPPGASSDPAAHAYEHVEISGTYLESRDTWVHASTDIGSGYWILSPLRLESGGVVLVNRGFVGMDVARDEVLQESNTHLTGLLRVSEPGGPWPRQNEPSRDRWYSRDVKGIASARGLQGVLPYFIDAEPATGNGASAPPAEGPPRAAMDGRRPMAGLTVVHFRNAHLSYALTWFALALMTAVAGAYAIRGELSGHARRT